MVLYFAAEGAAAGISEGTVTGTDGNDVGVTAEPLGVLTCAAAIACKLDASADAPATLQLKAIDTAIETFDPGVVALLYARIPVFPASATLALRRIAAA